MFQTFANAARDRGVMFGAYQFWIPQMPAQEQYDAFAERLSDVGYGACDMVPWIDVERFPIGGGEFSYPDRSWAPSLRQYLELIKSEMNVVPGVYMTTLDFDAIGSPEWLKRYYLWVAHHNEAGKPSHPWPWSIHQYRVGPYKQGAKHVIGQNKQRGAIDHNIARELPMMQGAQIPMLSLQPDWEEMQELTRRELATE